MVTNASQRTSGTVGAKEGLRAQLRASWAQGRRERGLLLARVLSRGWPVPGVPGQEGTACLPHPQPAQPPRGLQQTGPRLTSEAHDRDKYGKLIVVMFAKLCEQTKHHRVVDCKRVNCGVCEFSIILSRE